MSIFCRITSPVVPFLMYFSTVGGVLGFHTTQNRVRKTGHPTSQKGPIHLSSQGDKVHCQRGRQRCSLFLTHQKSYTSTANQIVQHRLKYGCWSWKMNGARAPCRHPLPVPCWSATLPGSRCSRRRRSAAAPCASTGSSARPAPRSDRWSERRTQHNLRTIVLLLVQLPKYKVN